MRGKERRMPFRIAIAVGSIVVTCVLGGCATGGSAGGASTFMRECLAKATTEAQRTECAWSNASRMASGR